LIEDITIYMFFKYIYEFALHVFVKTYEEFVVGVDLIAIVYYTYQDTPDHYLYMYIYTRICCG
jgi:hypothetical protein